jgi:hypothetical protein
VNNLGVTKMRMGQLWEAREIFARLVVRSPHFENGRLNFNDLTTFMRSQNMIGDDDMSPEAAMGDDDDDYDEDGDGGGGGDEFAQLVPKLEINNDGSRVRVFHDVSPLPRIRLADMSLPQNKEYAAGRLPFVISDLFNTTGWRNCAAKRLWSFKYFRQQFGDRMVDFYPHNMGKESARPIFLDMRGALLEAASPSGKFIKE